MKQGKLRIGENDMLYFYCPGCKTHHGVCINKDKPVHWYFNNNYDRPTFSPSILLITGHYPEPNDICHSFIVDGKIEFLSDCTHEFACKTVDME